MRLGIFALGRGGVTDRALVNVSQLDDWVLCRIYKKVNKHGGVGDQQRGMDCGEDSVEDAVAAYHHNSHAAAGNMAFAGGGNYTSLLHHNDSNFLDGLLTVENGGLAAGATSSLSHLDAVTRASPDVTKQLLAPASTPFNWLEASSAIAILPPAKRYHGFSRDTTDGGGSSLSSPAGAVDIGANSGGIAAIPTTYLNPLGVQQGATYHHHASILGTSSSLPPETAPCPFQNPYQLSGVNWNP
jgi:hypothetical protein